MKKAILFFVSTCLFLGVFAQTTTEGKKPTLWLENDSGKIAGVTKERIEKTFFKGDWVTVKANPAFTKSEHFMVTLQPPEGEKTAYTFVGNRISAEVMRGIERARSGTRISFMVQPQDGATTTYKETCTITLK